MVKPISLEHLNPHFSLQYASWVDKLPESEIRRLLRYSPKYYFAGGKPGILPIKAFHQIMEDIITEEKILLQNNSKGVLDKYNYGATEGNLHLRTILAERLKRRDNISCATAENMVITTGSQQILYGLCDVLISPGDVVLTTRPTYLGFLLPAEKLGATIVTLPSDQRGLIPEYIDIAVDLCKREFGKSPKILYTIPYSDNPKGTTLSQKRKQQIIDSAYSYNDLLIIEDAAYKEIQFKNGNSILHPLKEHDPENQRIAYLSTSTKEAAAFRLGYSLLPEELRKAVVKAKGYYDLCSSELVQAILAQYYEKYIDLQLPLIRQGYAERCETMLEAIQEFLPDGSFTTPTGGFFIWFETENQSFDSHTFVQIALDHGISFVPGVAFYPQKGYAITEEAELTKCIRPTNTLRLGYSLLTPKKIRKGIRLFGELLKKEIKEKNPNIGTFGYIRRGDYRSTPI